MWRCGPFEPKLKAFVQEAWWSHPPMHLSTSLVSIRGHPPLVRQRPMCRRPKLTVAHRNVFKFVLRPTINKNKQTTQNDYTHERMIPSHVKISVWKRDGGTCTTCGAKDGLHFDHIIPFSKGGRSDDAKNIQLLCARHNLIKSDHII